MSVWYIFNTLLKPISLGTASYTRGAWVESSHQKTILEQWSIELNYGHKECNVTSSGKTGKNEKGIQRSAIYGHENLRMHTLLPEFTHRRLSPERSRKYVFYSTVQIADPDNFKSKPLDENHWQLFIKNPGGVPMPSSIKIPYLGVGDVSKQFQPLDESHW